MVISKLNVLEYYYWLIIFIFVLASLSFVVSIIMIAIFITKSKSRTFIFELIFYLALAEAFGSISKMFSIYKILMYNESDNFYENIEKGLTDESSYMCMIQRIIGMYSDFSSFFISFVISYSLYKLILKSNKEILNYLPWVRVLCFVLPLIPALS